MRFRDFDYYLPPELIAQAPEERRDASRLMVLDRQMQTIAETAFSGITDLLRPGDLLVMNNTRVIPARLFGKKESGGRIEVLLLRRLAVDGETWNCLLRSSKKPRPGTLIELADGMTARVVDKVDEEVWTVSFQSHEGFSDWLDIHGAMPLPPYIRRTADHKDRKRYQTVFARVDGAVAAPTAGLHFTDELLRGLAARDVETAFVTLHVGLGTFLPVRVDHVHEHRMHREYFSIPEETAALVAERRKGRGRIIAVGTTTTRALEQSACRHGMVEAGEGEADIFIYPGYRFKAVDAMVTNFHLPCSTLLLLVAAFAGKDFLLRAYGEAVARRYRFFSYGDAMFIA